MRIGVRSAHFIGYMATEKGIKVNLDKIQAIQEMKPPTTLNKGAPTPFLMDPQQQQRGPPPPQRPPAAGGGGGDFSAIFTVLFTFVAIAAMIIVPSSSNLKQSLSVLHQVPEGHVGVYWRGGALLKTITGPGFHLKLPLITHFEPIQVTLQTDLVRDIPCGTKGGVMINFEKIEVVNRLHKDYVYETLLNYGIQYDNTWIYDKIHHEINQFCSAHSLQQVYIDMFDQESSNN
ncbi:UNVERIFIED_CONTAM: Erlin-2 [Sesamum latifolium]|uniref:Erlin-2 n=1 Tax=Sesamum latifolium TaxID=2727402 RepID=A0AAW2UUR4_9LAMI